MPDVHVLGLRLLQRGAKRIAAAVVIEADTGAVAECIQHVSNSSHNEATQARELRDAIGSALSAYQDLGAVVLYEADYHGNARVTKGTKTRLRLEGAALTACLDHAAKAQVMDGQAIGRACGGTKQDALTAADALGLGPDYVESAAAALAARSLIQL